MNKIELPRIYTSYYSGFFNCNHDYKNLVPISIALNSPHWYTGLEYKLISPTNSILMEYKSIGSEEIYRRRFYAEIIGHLNKDKTIEDLYMLSDCKDIVLLCFETPEKFCHRHIIAEWLNKDIKEIPIIKKGDIKPCQD